MKPTITINGVAIKPKSLDIVYLYIKLLQAVGDKLVANKKCGVIATLSH